MKFIAGRTCLDFVNTVGGRVSNVYTGAQHDYADTIVREKLGDYGDLLAWAEAAGAVEKQEIRILSSAADCQPAEASAVFARSIALREALYRIFKAAIEGSPVREPDLEILRREWSSAAANETLVHFAGKLSRVWNAHGSALDRILWPVARSAVDLLTSPEVVRVRQCGGYECGWLFLDTSRNHGRRWCDMKDCGNRAKVRRFRQRQRRD
ncbi:MAG: CGNR zinc finger domain-containing protein [Bryobacteraceae bacterium]